MRLSKLLEAADMAWTDGIQALGKTYHVAREDHGVFSVSWDNFRKIIENMDLARTEYYDCPGEDKQKQLQYWYGHYLEEAMDFARVYTETRKGE